MKKFTLYFLVIFLMVDQLHAQFAPAAGQPGTQAMHTDSSSFVTWASECMLSRGPVNISDLSQGYATFGDSSSAIGKADGLNVVSLGDGGYAILSFSGSIYDGPGYDFAVFENAFTDNYLEFGFVDVSSDGQNFFRFPSVSNITSSVQTGPFDLSDPSLVHNLAGKYRATFGTPFDLSELSGLSGLNTQQITHVKITDVVGSISNGYQSYDSQGNIINDPWPSPFSSCGFDLDGIGVINFNTSSKYELNSNINEFQIYPNPFESFVRVKANSHPFNIKLLSTLNEEIVTYPVFKNDEAILSLEELDIGIYILEISSKDKTSRKIIIKK